MAAVTIDASPAADPGLRGPVPARTARPAADPPRSRPARPDGPVLAVAGPGHPGRGRDASCGGSLSNGTRP